MRHVFAACGQDRTGVPSRLAVASQVLGESTAVSVRLRKAGLGMNGHESGALVAYAVFLAASFGLLGILAVLVRRENK